MHSVWESMNLVWGSASVKQLVFCICAKYFGRKSLSFFTGKRSVPDS
jgi:hypothetical protein